MKNNSIANVLRAGSEKPRKIIHATTRYLAYTGSILPLLMAVIIGIDVILRRFFNSPLTGIIELETFMLAVMCFFGLAYTLVKEGHVSVDILTTNISDKYKNLLNIAFSLLGFLIFLFICWQYSAKTIEAFRINEVSNMLSLPMGPFFFVVSFGSLLMCLVLFLNFIRNKADFLESNAQLWVSMVVLYVIIAGIVLSPIWLKYFFGEIDPSIIGYLMIIAMMLLLFLGFPVAFTMILIGMLGTWYLADFDMCLGVLKITVFDSVASYFFCVVPFFVLMGFFCLYAGISKRLYEAAHKWFGQMPGGLAIGTIMGCGGFAAICGDSMATAATMGSVALPEMKKYNYDDSLATGAIAAGGTLGILIPPSLGFIVYGIVTEESVGKLFMAGLVPGILLTVLFAVSIYIRCRFNPKLGPKAPGVSFKARITVLKRIWPVIALFVLVIGGIYMGWFTPTEGGGIGVIGALCIALISKEFGWVFFWESLLKTMEITAMVAAILIGVNILGYFITLTEIPMRLAGLFAGLNVSKYLLLAMILFLYLLLGMLMNIIPMIMITLPIIFPTILALGFDAIWFGVIMVIMMEMGQISPPVGINVFVISGVADVPMIKIFKGVLPFVIVQIIVIIILTFFPEIVLYLPSAMDMLPDVSY